jgi:hypothetical protein
MLTFFKFESDNSSNVPKKIPSMIIELASEQDLDHTPSSGRSNSSVEKDAKVTRLTSALVHM